MKSIGIVRNVDELGRIVVPKELRDAMGIAEKDPLEFFVEDEAKFIILKQYNGNGCLFCGNLDGVTYFKGKLICDVCMKQAPQEAISQSSVSKDTISEKRRSHSSRSAGTNARNRKSEEA